MNNHSSGNLACKFILHYVCGLRCCDTNVLTYFQIKTCIVCGSVTKGIFFFIDITRFILAVK